MPQYGGGRSEPGLAAGACEGKRLSYKSDNPICEVLNNTKILKLLESSNFKDLLNSENVKAIIDIFKENQLKGKKIKDEESEN